MVTNISKNGVFDPILGRFFLGGRTCQFGHHKHHHSTLWTVGGAFFGDRFDASPLLLGPKLTPSWRFGDHFGVSSPPAVSIQASEFG